MLKYWIIKLYTQKTISIFLLVYLIQRYKRFSINKSFTKKNWKFIFLSGYGSVIIELINNAKVLWIIQFLYSDDGTMNALSSNFRTPDPIIAYQYFTKVPPYFNLSYFRAKIFRYATSVTIFPDRYSND